MSIEVSVILIAFNKYPQCLYSLYALECQTFDHSKMEVILVDDFSTDETPELQNYQPPFRFKYIRPEKNVGRSKAKNIGIESSEGDIIIFLDSEFLVDPNFIEAQYNYHQTDQLLAVSTCLNHYGVYTVFDTHYPNIQKSHFRRIAKKGIKRLPEHAQRIVKKSLEGRADQEKIGFFQKKDIENLSYQALAFPTPYIPEVIEVYGREFHNFHMPWMFVITHQLSVKRSVINQIGLFYEGFDGYGVEDWEFGYRLYKHGVKIIDNEHGSIFHQEHPRNIGSDTWESDHNYLTFFKLYRDFDIGCYFLWRLGKDLYFINDTESEYRALCAQYPDQFQELKETFLRFFEVILEETVSRRKVTNLVQISGLEQEILERAFVQKKSLEEQNMYPHLTMAMDFILNL
ncbi:glycosyltransferase [Neobacillus pocheonensis]|uniref:glycosyltransferase family 2 protein n=1 Tax=Neobacillus pocheonensis TaxID=363869 RepID=UPI003D2C72FD